MLGRRLSPVNLSYISLKNAVNCLHEKLKVEASFIVDSDLDMSCELITQPASMLQAVLSQSGDQL